MLNKISLIYLFSILIVFSSCKGRKNRNGEKPQVIQMDYDSIFNKGSVSDMLKETLPSWTFFSAKIDVDFKSSDGKTIRPNAHIRMFKDSLIWVSGGLFGIEGFRMIINKDSMVLLNKLDRTYSIFNGNLTKAFSDLPLTVTQLQNLIIGKPIYALTLYDFLNKSDSHFSILNKQKQFNTIHTYQKTFLTIDTSAIKSNDSSRFVKAKYAAFTVVNKHNFPVNTGITATDGKKTIVIDMVYSNIDFESALDFPFTIPSSYEKTK